MDIKVYNAASILARLLGLEAGQHGNHFVLYRDGEIILYVFSKAHLPRFGLYGYYAAHFIEIWENDLLSKGLNTIKREDPFLEQVVKALAAVGEEIIRVGRLRGKYGDPHVSIFLETRHLQVIREYMDLGGVRANPRLNLGGYSWRFWSKPSRAFCNEQGVTGWIDGVLLHFSSKRIGFVRGLTLFQDCRVIAGEEDYNKMEDLEEKKLEDVVVKKLPYKLVAKLSSTGSAECCGYRVIEAPGEKAWETPIWKRVYDRYELQLRYITFMTAK